MAPAAATPSSPKHELSRPASSPGPSDMRPPPLPAEDHKHAEDGAGNASAADPPRSGDPHAAFPRAFAQPAGAVNANPVVQVVEIAPVQPKQPSPDSPDLLRYRLVLSDSQNLIDATLSTEMNRYINSGEIAKGSFLRLTSYIANRVKDKKQLIVMAVEPLPQLGIQEIRGSPIAIDDMLNGARSAERRRSSAATIVPPAGPRDEDAMDHSPTAPGAVSARGSFSGASQATVSESARPHTARSANGASHLRLGTPEHPRSPITPGASVSGEASTAFPGSARAAPPDEVAALREELRQARRKTNLLEEEARGLRATVNQMWRKLGTLEEEVARGKRVQEELRAQKDELVKTQHERELRLLAENNERKRKFMDLMRTGYDIL